MIGHRANIPLPQEKRMKGVKIYEKAILHCLWQQPFNRTDAVPDADAKIVGRAILYGWQLVFKVHATIEENPKKKHTGAGVGNFRSG